MIAGVLAVAACPGKGGAGVPQSSSGSRPLDLGGQTRVFLAGVGRGASEQAVKSSVRAAAEAANDAVPQDLRKRLSEMTTPLV